MWKKNFLWIFKMFRLGWISYTRRRCNSNDWIWRWLRGHITSSRNSILYWTIVQYSEIDCSSAQKRYHSRLWLGPCRWKCFSQPSWLEGWFRCLVYLQGTFHSIFIFNHLILHFSFFIFNLVFELWCRRYCSYIHSRILYEGRRQWYVSDAQRLVGKRRQV